MDIIDNKYIDVPLAFPDEELIGKGVTSLRMRKPRAKDEISAVNLAKHQGEVEMLILANVCAVSSSVIENLELYDLRQLRSAYEMFEKGAHRPKPKT